MPQITTTLRIPHYASAPGSPLTGQMYYNTTDNTIYWYNGTTWGAVATGSPAPLPGNVVLLTAASGTYTPTSGVRALYVEMVGGGGGGGQAQGTASQCAAGSGGGAGGYAAKYIASPSASYPYVVGAAGIHNPAGAGGNSTFGSASVCTAVGGGAGAAGVSGTVLQWIVGGGNGGLPTVGDVLIQGEAGQPGWRGSATQGKGGDGGQSAWGAGGRGSYGSGTPTQVPSCGGGGAAANSTSASSFWGQPGAAGLIKVTEYF